MGQRPLPLDVFDSPINAGRFENPNQNWKLSAPIDLLENHDLVLVELTDDDFRDDCFGVPLDCCSEILVVSSASLFLLLVLPLRSSAEAFLSSFWRIKPPERILLPAPAECDLLLNFGEDWLCFNSVVLESMIVPHVTSSY